MVQMNIHNVTKISEDVRKLYKSNGTPFYVRTITVSDAQSNHTEIVLFSDENDFGFHSC